MECWLLIITQFSLFQVWCFVRGYCTPSSGVRVQGLLCVIARQASPPLFPPRLLLRRLHPPRQGVARAPMFPSPPPPPPPPPSPSSVSSVPVLRPYTSFSHGQPARHHVLIKYRVNISPAIVIIVFSHGAPPCTPHRSTPGPSSAAPAAASLPAPSAPEK